MKINKLTPLILLPILLSSCATYWDSSVSNYDTLLKQCRDNPDFHTQLLIFPESTNKGTPTFFQYKMTEDLLTGSYFFYLVMTYNQDVFDTELERISSVKTTFPEDRGYKTIIPYVEQNIYLSIDRQKRYEYAIFDKEKLEIAYVSNQLYSWVSVKLSKSHRLPDLLIPSELDDGENSYNMYYYYEMFMDLYTGVYCLD